MSPPHGAGRLNVQELALSFARNAPFEMRQCPSLEDGRIRVPVICIARLDVQPVAWRSTLDARVCLELL